MRYVVEIDRVDKDYAHAYVSGVIGEDKKGRHLHPAAKDDKGSWDVELPEGGRLHARTLHGIARQLARRAKLTGAVLVSDEWQNRQIEFSVNYSNRKGSGT